LPLKEYNQFLHSCSLQVRPVHQEVILEDPLLLNQEGSIQEGARAMRHHPRFVGVVSSLVINSGSVQTARLILKVAMVDPVLSGRLP